MINKGLFVSCLLLFTVSLNSLAQIPNSWIDFGQSYYKVPVVKDGIYKLSYSDLVAAGFPVGSVDPRRLQLFHRGVEQAIFVQGQADAVLNAGDYLEFFGKKNDGTRDANLYKPSSLQLNPYYNIYSDTAAYFLTWNFTNQGKRMATFSEVNVTNIPAETFQTSERLIVLSDQYAGGYTENDELQQTKFDLGEGWTGTALRQGQTVDYTLDLITNTAQTSGSPQLEVLLVGRDNISHSYQVYVGQNAGSLRLVDAQDFFGFGTVNVKAILNWSDIGADGKMLVRVSAIGSGTQRFQFSTTYIKLNFPQSYDMAGVNEKFIQLPTNIAGKSYLELNNPTAGLRLWDVTDANNLVIIGQQISGSTASVVIANTQTSRILFASNTTLTATIQPVSFRQINPTSHNYLIVTHKSLLKPAGSYANVIEAYASYRASPEGGSYDTLTVTMDQLYNQFNYGETSSLAIYEFIKYMVNGGNPKYLFLIGKGRDVYSHRSSQLSIAELKDLVPTAGSPGSDMAFSAGLNGTSFDPAIPTGRLTATKPEQVAAYLNKVKETELIFSNPDEQLWRKKGLHLSGGIQPFELGYFKNVVNGFKLVAEDIYWGAKITTLSKREPNPVEVINVTDKINEGVNLVTFFGHSSPNTIDIDIGYVTNPTLNYNNPGKYPVFLINGCNAGNSFSNGIAFGEDWMMASNKGARNFIAHSSFGFTNTLQRYSKYFYEIGFGDSIFMTKGIGDVQKEIARRYLESDGATMPVVTQVQQMLLLGDPAMKLFGSTKPDFETNDNSIFLESLDGSPVTALSDSFAVKVIVKNFGAVRNDPLKIELTRLFNDGTSKVYNNVFKSPFFQDTIVFKLLKEQIDGSGNNQFSIKLDPANEAIELIESNNTGKLLINIPSNGSKNLYPLPYSLVSGTSVNFLFQDTDLLGEKREFQLEIDTVHSFDSPYLKQLTVSGKVLAQRELVLINKDTLVYFWRTKFKQPAAGESKDWVTSSFTIIKNSPEGWAQGIHQLSEDKLINLNYDQNKGLAFKETSSDIFVRTFGSNNPAPYTSVSLKIDNSEYNLSTQFQPCRNNTINLVAFNKSTTVPYPGIPFNFQDPRTCGREPQLINSFLVSEIETGHGDDLITYINNIGMSDSVLIFSIGDPGYPSWSSAVKSKLVELGIDQSDISSLEAGEPVIIFGRKGASIGTAKIITTTILPKQDQELQIAETIIGRAATGKMNSSLIGPAQGWQKIITRATDVSPNDIYGFTVYAVKIDGTDSLIQTNIQPDFDLSSLNAQHFPFVRIEATFNDEVDLTPAQLKNWLVLYEPVAEGLLLHVGDAVKSTLQEGAPWSDQFKFINISKKNFSDSLSVDVEVFNQLKLKKETQKFSIKSPVSGDSTMFKVKVNTTSKVGLNDLHVFVNRKVIAEQYYDNNSISLQNYIEVTPDNIRPQLDVTIDGRYIRNYEYVSTSPTILVKVKDENPFLFKTDTLGITILLRSTCSTAACDFVRISFTDPDLRWFPATATTDFRVEYHPNNLPDGEYTLNVIASDATGNSSTASSVGTGNLQSDGPYEVTFLIKNETTFLFKSVYPNPSSDNFFFQFQLTGNAFPDHFSLQIFTIEGRQVHEFTENDVVNFNLGFNDLIWQGRDQAGLRLPNGMYIYRLTVATETNEVSQQGKLILSH